MTMTQHTFEAWAKSQGLDTRHRDASDQYVESTTELAWQSWVAYDSSVSF